MTEKKGERCEIKDESQSGNDGVDAHRNDVNVACTVVVACSGGVDGHNDLRYRRERVVRRSLINRTVNISCFCFRHKPEGELQSHFNALSYCFHIAIACIIIIKILATFIGPLFS